MPRSRLGEPSPAALFSFAQKTLTLLTLGKPVFTGYAGQALVYSRTEKHSALLPVTSSRLSKAVARHENASITAVECLPGGAFRPATPRRTTPMKSGFITLLIAILLGIIYGPAFLPTARGQTVDSWTSSSDGKWETATDWSAGAPPSANELLIAITNGVPSFMLNKIVTIDLTTATSAPGSMAIQNLIVAGQTVGPHKGNDLLLSNTSGNPADVTLSVNQNITISTLGALVITNATLTMGDVNGGNFVNDDGKIELDSGSLAIPHAQVTIGNSTNGLFTMNGGTWTPSIVHVGNLGLGTLTISGGTVTAGLVAVADGTMLMTGGQLVVLGGDAVFIGSGLNAFAQVIISNGTLEVQGNLLVGRDGPGTLAIAGGISMALSNVSVGNASCSAAGNLLVEGGSLFVTNAAHNAVLDLENGALTLSGGTLVVDTLVKTNPCATFQQTGGTLVVGGVTTLFSSLFSITAIGQEGNNMRITWQSPGGLTNMVQATNGGPSDSYNTNFVDLPPPIIITGVGLSTTNYLDVGGATNKPARYYRVRLVP